VKPNFRRHRISLVAHRFLRVRGCLGWSVALRKEGLEVFFFGDNRRTELGMPEDLQRLGEPKAISSLVLPLDGNFGHETAQEVRLGQDLCVYEVAIRLDGDSFENMPPK